MSPLKTIIIYIFFLVCCLSAGAQYKSLLNNLDFKGDHIIYKGKKIQLGPKSFFVDGRLTDVEIKKYKYVYNSINEAAKHLTNGTETAPMTLYIAPYVYWIDDPNDPLVRVPRTGQSTPFGLEIACEWLTFYGLSDDASNVVLASNRGQTMGAKGNFTMFNIKGDGTRAENITFGNYCNVDLEYKLIPSLSRKKRGSAIVQAQLVFCNGDKLFARNTRFISRLNLCPMIGGKRTLFESCHFESTDDALNGNAVYLNCSFDFYSGKPFWGTSGTGAVFLNCDIHSFTKGEQFFVKSGGQVVVVDTRFHSTTLNYIGWKNDIPAQSRNYQFNVKLNGKPIFIESRNSLTTVDMTNKPVLNAYRFQYKGKIIYNAYNLLKGDDDWDPLNLKPMATVAEKAGSTGLANMATQLRMLSPTSNIETGKDSVILEAVPYRFGNFQKAGEEIKWSVADNSNRFIRLTPLPSGRCVVVPANNGDTATTVYVIASTKTGLEAASAVNVLPRILSAPGFQTSPTLIHKTDGTILVDYQLDTELKDASVITWYRCRDANGTDPVEVAVSRFNIPKKEYKLSAGDVGYYLKAEITPKHIRSLAGASKSVMNKEQIKSADVNNDAKIMNVDFAGIPTKNQHKVIPGFFTLDAFAPDDTREFDWKADNTKDAWYYGNGVDGSANDTGLVQAVQGARLRYTPVERNYGNMKMSFTAVPAKTAGQGFGSARAQYLDVFIKFDNNTLTGYALRVIRTTKFSDAVDFILMKYNNGVAAAVSKPVSATCFRPDCHITLEIAGNKFKVHADNPKDYFSEPGRPELVRAVKLEADILPNDFGGLGFQHTGTVGAGATLIKDIIVEWK